MLIKDHNKLKNHIKNLCMLNLTQIKKIEKNHQEKLQKEKLHKQNEIKLLSNF